MNTVDTISLEAADESLARRARAGDSSALDLLARRWQIPLVRFLQRRVGNQSDAEDLYQETFVRVFQNLQSYDDGRSFKTWIFTIAWRLAANHLRDRRITGGEESLAALTDNAQTPHDHAAERELHGGLWDIARASLSEEQYNILWLFYVEQLTPRQIAQVTGRSWVGIKTALHRARRALAPHVQELAEKAM